MNVRRWLRRVAALIVHNWPLKLAAVVVATLLYTGLVASRDSSVYPGPIQVTPIHQPAGTKITSDIPDVESVRYLAPTEDGRLTATDFRATIDLTGVKADAVPVNIPVNIQPIDPRVTIIEVTPPTIQVVLDKVITKIVDVVVDRGTPPAGIDVGATVVNPAQVTILGPSAAVNKVVAVRVSTPIDSSGLDIDREIQPIPVDANGEAVTGVNIEPRTVRVTIPVYTNRQSRSLPVNPIITGTPAPGFRIAAITVSPLAVSVQGDQNQLVSLIQADTQPVAVFGATSDVTTTVPLALPSGVVPIGTGTIDVTVKIEPVTATRTYAAGVRLDGSQPDLDYTVSPDRVLLTLYGSVAVLDRLGSAPIVVGLNVSALGPGTHDVPIVPSLPSGITVAAMSVQTVTVTITSPLASPSPTASGPTGSASPSPGAP